MEIVAEQRTSDHPMIINGELVQGSTGLSDPVCVAPFPQSLNSLYKTEKSSNSHLSLSLSLSLSLYCGR